MTDRERYIQARKEARRYRRKYLRYKNAMVALVSKLAELSGDAEGWQDALARLEGEERE